MASDGSGKFLPLIIVAVSEFRIILVRGTKISVS